LIVTGPVHDSFSNSRGHRLTGCRTARGNIEYGLPASNPSLAYRVSTSASSADGANLLFYDGHVEWVNTNRLVDVGYDNAFMGPCNNGDVMSVLALSPSAFIPYPLFFILFCCR
jgi:prepilin-type processing-associated H-X9-DG protein